MKTKRKRTNKTTFTFRTPSTGGDSGLVNFRLSTKGKIEIVIRAHEEEFGTNMASGIYTYATIEKFIKQLTDLVEYGRERDKE